jgi:hypothetical protein
LLTLAALLPFAAAIGLMLGLWRRLFSWERALGLGFLAWGTAAWAVSEAASAAGCLNGRAMAGVWLPALLAAWAWAMRAPRALTLPRAGGAAWALGAGLALLALYLAVLGARMPMANFDSLLYHLPRVEQWAQNGSLRPFPTPYDLQDFYAPLAEEAVLQLRLLTGANDWAGLVQGWAWLGCLAGSAALALTLGAGPWGAGLAALSFAALPMGVLQAVTAQTDLVCALWLIWAAVFTLRFGREQGTGEALAAAAALGLGLATKGTYYLFGLPWGLGLAWLWMRAHGRERSVIPLLMLLLIAVPSAGPWWRNVQLSGSFLGSSDAHVVDPWSLRGAASSLLKNLAYDALPTDPEWVHRIHLAVKELHAALGWPLNDPASTYGGMNFGHYGLAGQWHEDYAGSPWHLLGFAAVFAAAFAGWRKKSAVPWVLAGAAAGYLLYASIIRYNVWCNRLHLPVLALLCAPLGLALEDALPKRAYALAGALLLAYGSWAATHHYYQAWDLVLPGPAQAEFAKNEAWRCGLSAGWNAGQGGAKVGIWQAERELEEPLWVGLRQAGAGRIQQLRPSPSTRRALEDPAFQGFVPDVIVADDTPHTAPILEAAGRRWRREMANEIWAVYRPLP